MTNYRDNHNLPAGCPIESPWGRVQHGTKIADGMFVVSTAGHGGFKLSVLLNSMIPVAFRNDNGWYEEDCEAYKVVHFFPGLFQPDQVTRAAEALKHWNWQEWERHYGVALTDAESHMKADHNFKLAHKDSLLTISAYGDWHMYVPKGMVGVCASRGGSREYGVETRGFLVTKEEYDKRSENASGSLVIDPATATPWEFNR